MSAITTISTVTVPSSTDAIDAPAEAPRLWGPGMLAGAGAAAATCMAVAAARAAGAEVAIAGERVPLSGFATLTVVGAALGVLLAKVMARRAQHARQTFVRVTVVLTGLSMVPDALIDAGAASRLLLAATHVIAAAIIVPVLARRLDALSAAPRRRTRARSQRAGPADPDHHTTPHLPSSPTPAHESEQFMPQYLMSVWHDDDYESTSPPEEMQRIVAQVGAFNEELSPPAPGCSAAGCTRLLGHRRARRRRRGVDDRRPLRRDQGADGRLLGHRGRRPRRRPRLGRARRRSPARARSRCARIQDG